MPTGLKTADLLPHFRNDQLGLGLLSYFSTQVDLPASWLDFKLFSFEVLPYVRTRQLD